MLTGALAASYYGVPRTTMDLDIVVKVSLEKSKAELVFTLEKAAMKVNRRMIDRALNSGYGIVTLQDSRSPFTVDIILSKLKLEKRPGRILSLPTFYQTPESLILAKLRMIKATLPKERALKDKDDVKAILRFTKVRIRSVKRRARSDSTLPILETITS